MILNNSEIKKLAICLYLVGMLNACIKKENIKSPSSFSNPMYTELYSDSPTSSPLPEKKVFDSILTVQQIRQIEAKHADLPVPIGAVPLPVHCSYDNKNNEQLKLAYRCTDTAEAIALFYDQNMEGWQEIARFEGEEFLIHYQRPDKWCTVAIRLINSKHEPNLIIYWVQKIINYKDPQSDHSFLTPHNYS